jgi:hypothetical protein
VPDPLPDPPNWHDARAFAAVWRDAFPMALGGLVAMTKSQFAGVRLYDGWDLDPEPGSDADVDQAIGAKIHLALRLMPVLAESQLVHVGPDQVDAIPEWEHTDRASNYGQEAKLPGSPIFLDFESVAGQPASWQAESWPLPFHLRGALLWGQDGVLCGIDFGSVQGTHLFGGTDYQAWSRWVYWQQPDREPPPPGPGDSIVIGEDAISWVRYSESVCAHQAAVGYHLMSRVLRVLWAIETFDMQLETPRLPRPERRRAARAEQVIGVVVPRLPGCVHRRRMSLMTNPAGIPWSSLARGPRATDVSSKPTRFGTRHWRPTTTRDSSCCG